jgi:hypothetical protein
MQNRSSFALTVMFCVAVTRAFAQGVALPMGFDGDYVPDGASCTPDMAVTVMNGTITGPEFVITVTDLAEDPVDPRKVQATVDDTGEGETSTSAAVITLSENGQELTLDYSDGISDIFLRCPRQP